MMSELSELRADVRAMRQAITELLEVLGPTLPPVKTAKRHYVVYRASDGVEVPPADSVEHKAFLAKVHQQIRDYPQLRLVTLGESQAHHLMMKLHYFSQTTTAERAARPAAALSLAEELGLLVGAEVWTFFEHPFRQPNVRKPGVPTLAAAQRARLTE